MNQRGNNRNRRRSTEMMYQKKIVRCVNLQRPVYEHESCPQYQIKVGGESQKICKNCKYSF